MARASLDRVRWLSVREIAEMWAPELGRPEALVLRELQYGVSNLPRLRRGEELFGEPPSHADLPDPRTVVSREWMEEFCGKNCWPFPRFWFGEEEPVRPVGRPTLRDAIVERFVELVEKGQIEATISAQARVLYKWAKDEFPGERTPEPKTIQNHIRDEWRLAKQRPA